MIVTLIPVLDDATGEGAWGWFSYAADGTTGECRTAVMSDVPLPSLRVLELEAACDALETFTGPLELRVWTPYLPSVLADVSDFRRREIKSLPTGRPVSNHELALRLLRLCAGRVLVWKVVDRDSEELAVLREQVRALLHRPQAHPAADDGQVSG